MPPVRMIPRYVLHPSASVVVLFVVLISGAASAQELKPVRGFAGAGVLFPLSDDARARLRASGPAPETASRMQPHFEVRFPVRGRVSAGMEWTVIGAADGLSSGQQIRLLERQSESLLVGNISVRSFRRKRWALDAVVGAGVLQQWENVTQICPR